jgi:hypothetical protein
MKLETLKRDNDTLNVVAEIVEELDEHNIQTTKELFNSICSSVEEP